VKKNLIFSLIFIFAGSLPVFAQVQQVASVIHYRHTINSVILGEERTVLVQVPENYAQSNEKYPVVYMLDAHPPQNAMMAGILQQQAWGNQIPEMILVGIQNINRSRDLTPTDDGKGGKMGGGDKFLDFIEKEVMPLVEKNYRTQPFRIFAGHSLGGLTVVYSFVSHPAMFNAYIAASPVLGWDNNFVIKQAEKVFEQKKDWKKTMFLGIGDEPEYIKGFNSFKDLLKKSNPKGFDYEFRQFPDDNHASVVLPAYYAGLRKIFAGWTPPQTGSVGELENHYKKLSEKFGYEIKIPEAMLNQIGYQFLRSGNFLEAIEIFKKNVANYPDSANVYDSLAETYEKNGQLKQAAENYEKAYKIAETQGNHQLANASKANYERVLAKFKK
jgi:uncharacterized protein